MTREEVERACEQISEWTKFSSRPIHHTTLRILDNDAEQRAALADKDMEITTCNLALLERDREIERLTQDRDMLKYALQGSHDQCQQLREILQQLYDMQNGCPLPKYEHDWKEAMQQAERLLNQWKEAL